MAEIVVVEPSIASTSRGHGSNQNNNGTKPLSMKSITSGRDYVPEPFDSEKLPVTLRSEIQRFLRVANLIDAQEPRVACLCRLYAFEVAHDLDRNSSGRGVRKFKAALLQRVEQDEEVTYRKRKERNDVREVGRVYREYKDYIIEHGGESTLENREALIKAGAIAAVLYEVSNILTKAAGTQTLPMAEWEEVQQELIHQAGQQELLHPEDPYFNPDLVHPEEFEGNPEEPEEDPQMDLGEESEDDSEEDPEEEEQDEMSDEGPIDDSDDGEDPSVIDGQYQERDFSAPRLLPSYKEYRHPNRGPLWRYTLLKPIPHVPSTRPTYDLGQSSQSSFPGTARGTSATSTIPVLAAQVSRLDTQTLASNMELTSLDEVVRAMSLHIRSPEEDRNLDEEAIDITRAELVES